MDRYLDQAPYLVRFDWGAEGALRAAARGDVLVVIDVLCFSTTVVTAVAQGAVIYPHAHGEDAAALGALLGAEVAVSLEEVPKRGRFSLSPESFLGVEPGTRVVLDSANGAVCVRASEKSLAILVGALVNASAAARAAERLAEQHQAAITVIACGERWPGSGGLRVAVEDALGAGAVLTALSGEASPEAAVCANAYRASINTLPALLWDCASARELRTRGFPKDVEHAMRLDAYDYVPALLPSNNNTTSMETAEEKRSMLCFTRQVHEAPLGRPRLPTFPPPEIALCSDWR